MLISFVTCRLVPVSFVLRRSKSWPARSLGGQFEKSNEEGKLGLGRTTGEVPAD